MNLEVYFTKEVLTNTAIAIGIFLLFLIFRKLFTKYILSLIIKLSRKAPTSFFTTIIKAFERPIQWLFIVIGIYVAARYLTYFNHAYPLFISILRAALIALFSWGLFNLSSKSSLVFAKVSQRFSFEIDEILLPFLSKVIRIVIVAISLSVILQEFGYDVNGFIAGLGLGGLAFALAAKDAISNLFGGIIIITEKPFTIGDWILTNSVEGTVEDITFRSTKVRTFDQALVTVPNATLANEPITNWSKMGKRQITFNLQLFFETPNEKVKKVVKEIEQLLRNSQHIHQETIIVRFREFDEDALVIYLYFFTNTTSFEEYLRVREEVNFAIKGILENAGVELSIPSSRIYVDKPFEDLEEKNM